MQTDLPKKSRFPFKESGHEIVEITKELNDGFSRPLDFPVLKHFGLDVENGLFCNIF